MIRGSAGKAQAWCSADTNRRRLSHTRTAALYVHLPYQILSPSSPALSCLPRCFQYTIAAAALSSCCPIKREHTNNNQTVLPALPTLFTTGSFPLCSHAPSLLFSASSLFPPSCIVLCPQVRGSLCFLLLKLGRKKKTEQEEEEEGDERVS